MPQTCPTPQALQKMIDETLGAESGDVESHVADCPACQDVLERLTRPETEGGGTLWNPPTGGGPSPHLTLACKIDEAARETPSEALPNVSGYVVERVLGRGGMGVVYLAWQVNANRRVALKMMSSGRARAEDLVRFRLEGENLARLRHPNIIQVYEAGAVGDRPFFSMEYVAGGTLGQSFDVSPRTYVEAATLLETLARAVHVAHQCGVVHRDLKPANILIDDDSSGGTPGTFKITDFGLAKRVGSDSGLTQTGEILGTPSYMAPEQASGGWTVGIPADVYALGAILYEALTGRPPFRGGSPWETLMKVVHEAPPLPSRIRPGLPRDLEVICLKCLAKKPEDRYASADALAEDVRRWREGLPIAARPAGLARRAWLWSRRHPAYAALGSLLAASVVAGATGVAVQWTRAERHLDQSRRRVDLALKAIESFYTGTSEDVLLRRPELSELRNSLLSTPLRFYQSLREELEAGGAFDRESQTQLVDILARLGGINRDVGREEDALQAYLEAAETARSLLRDDPHNHSIRRALGDALVEASQIDARTSRSDQARARLVDAIEVFDSLARELPGDLEVQDGRASCLHFLGDVDCDDQNFQSSEGRYLASIAIRRGLIARSPNNAQYLDNLGGTENNLAIMYAQWNKLDDAGRWFREGLESRRRLAREHGETANYLRKFASSLNNYGSFLQNTDRMNDAPPYFQQAGAIQESLVRDHPTVALYQDDLAVTHENIAAHLADIGKGELAQAQYRLSLAIRERLAADHPTSLDYQARLVLAHLELSTTVLENREYARAEDEARSAASALDRASKHHSGSAEFRRLKAETARRLGDVHASMGRSSQAESSYTTALELAADAGREGASAESRLDRARDLLLRGAARAAIGRLDAEADISDALAMVESLLKEQPSVSRYRALAAETRLGQAEMALRRQRREEGVVGPVDALEGFTQAAEEGASLLREEPGDDAARGVLARALVGRARTLEMSGRLDESCSAWDQALAGAPERWRLLVELGRAATLCRRGLIEEATTIARSAKGMQPEKAVEEVARARVLARASDAVAAVSCLERATSGPDRGDGLAILELLDDPDFAPLRGRPDFESLRKSLAFPADPFAPAGPP